MAAPTTKSAAVTEFAEPPATYAVTAIPLQPVAFAAPTTMVTTLPTPEVPLRQPLVMSSQIQDQLQKKHEQLQQLIVQQQEELRRVSEQLFMARYGLLQPLINVTMPYTVPPTAPHLTVAATSPAELFVPGHPSQRPHIMIDPHQVNYQQAQSSDEAMQHFQFPVQQAQQILFSQNLDSPNSTQHSQ